MLSEKEKKAIEDIEKTIKLYNKKSEKEISVIVDNFDIDILNTILKLVNRQKEQLETTEQKYILEKVAKEEVEELLENSVSKDIIRKYLEEEQQRYNVYKKELKENDNLKSGMWRHRGAKNMCEKILGIESLVTLD